jgi:hypothetical protein
VVTAGGGHLKCTTSKGLAAHIGKVWHCDGRRCLRRAALFEWHRLCFTAQSFHGVPKREHWQNRQPRNECGFSRIGRRNDEGLGAVSASRQGRWECSAHMPN